ncbi:MAG: tetratricopeptide repeat protein [Phocaeicola sp.]|nr:tetratricopeptide repeat protein [Phocaeicola sp.]
MTEQLQDIKILIEQGDTKRAIQELTELIQCDAHVNDELYYLLGNAYRKMGNWQQALNNYLEAIERNPESSAVSARDMLMNILNFYNKDMYNQ